MEVTKAKFIDCFYNDMKPFSALTTITGRIITVREIINMVYMAHCLAASAWLERNTNVAVHTFPKAHDDVIKWNNFPRYWPFVRGIHRSPVNSPHKGQWRGPLMFSLICVWINGWVNDCEAGDLRRHLGHYDVIVMRNGITFFRLLQHNDIYHSNSTTHWSLRDVLIILIKVIFNLIIQNGSLGTRN